MLALSIKSALSNFGLYGTFMFPGNFDPLDIFLLGHIVYQNNGKAVANTRIGKSTGDEAKRNSSRYTANFTSTASLVHPGSGTVGTKLLDLSAQNSGVLVLLSLSL